MGLTKEEVDRMLEDEFVVCSYCTKKHVSPAILKKEEIHFNKQGFVECEYCGNKFINDIYSKEKLLKEYELGIFCLEKQIKNPKPKNSKITEYKKKRLEQTKIIYQKLKGMRMTR